MIPKLDLDEAGLGWLLDPVEAVQATENQVRDALQAFLFYQNELEGLLIDSINAEEEDAAKKVQLVMRSLKVKINTAQSLLASFRAERR